METDTELYAGYGGGSAGRSINCNRTNLDHSYECKHLSQGVDCRP